MTFKSAIWHPIAVLLSVINFAGVGFAVASAEPWHATIHAGLALAFGVWAQRLRRGSGGSELARVKQQVDQLAAALEDAQSALADQSTQIAELHERVDFAERLLAQARDRLALGTREERR
jgi:hypothetical protein